MKYKKKPVVIEAIEWDGEKETFNKLAGEWSNWSSVFSRLGDGFLTIKTLKGNMKASNGDYIIKGVKGEFYPCKPDIFHMTYEEIEDKMSKELVNTKTNYVNIQKLYEMVEDLTIKLESNLKKEVELGQWIDLVIDELPDRFFTRDDIEITPISGGSSCDSMRSKKESRAGLINELVYGDIKYRYRIKPLESIRITREMWKLYCNYWGLNVLHLEVDNRPVKIID